MIELLSFSFKISEEVAHIQREKGKWVGFILPEAAASFTPESGRRVDKPKVTQNPPRQGFLFALCRCCDRQLGQGLKARDPAIRKDASLAPEFGWG